MLKSFKRRLRSERGDTLVEVTFALGIMATVIVSATLVSTRALKLGSLARARVQLVNAAEQQVEAVRSLRDNNLWTVYLYGNVAGPGHFNGVMNSAGTACKLQSDAGHNCFVMVSQAVGGPLVPQSGSLVGATSTPPGSVIEIPTPAESGAKLNCFTTVYVHYGIPETGTNVWQEGEIAVKLVRLDWYGAAGDCS